MMYFDLDRTIVFSEKTTKDVSDLSVVEEAGDDSISYATAKSLDIISELVRRKQFVPVTARNFEQYSRLELSHEQPQWVITSNGGEIYHNGVKDESWNEIIRHHLPENYQQFYQYQANLAKEHGLEIKLVDDMFHYVVLENDEHEWYYEEVDMSFTILPYCQDWKLIRQGDRMFFLPKSITKKLAVEYISSQTNTPVVFTAGSSPLDVDYVRLGNDTLIPKNSRIFGDDDNSDLPATTNTGALAGEEILLRALELDN